MTSDADISDEWDEDTMIELRRFGFEHALSLHQAKGAGADLAAIFKDADRIVNYVLGDLAP